MKCAVLPAALFGLVLSGFDGMARELGNSIKVPGIPFDLIWDRPPASWSFQQGELTITAGPKTDLFRDPRGEYVAENSPRALFAPDEHFILSGRVSVAFVSDYDAGVLMLFGSDDRWAKLCFEYSPQKKPMVVSVVNDGISDDANHAEIDGEEVFLRISGLGRQSYAFHYSLDGKTWRLVRYFHLKSKEGLRLGLSAQSPTGSSCRAAFSQLLYEARKLANIRGGE